MDFPHVSIDYFITGFKKANRKLFQILLALTIILTALLIYADFNLYEINISLQKDVQPIATEIPINKFSNNYMEVEQKLPVFTGFSYFYASLIKPNKYIIAFLFIILSIAWSSIVSSASIMKNSIKIAVYIIYAIFLYSLKFPELFGIKNGINYYLISLLLMVPPAIALWWFEKKQPPLITKFIITFLINLGIGAIYFYKEKYAGLHSIFTNSFAILVIILLFYLIISSHTIIFSWIWAGYQRRKKEKRISLPVFIFGSIFIIAITAFTFIKRVNLIDIELAIPLIPFSIVLGIINILFVFIFQNFFIAYQRLFKRNSAFSIGILGLILLVNSFILFNLFGGEYLFKEMLNHIGWLILTAGNIAAFVYIIREHKELLYHKINLFYEIFRRAVNPYISVWFILIFIISGWEYYKSRRELILLLAVQSNAKADNQLLNNNLEDAKNYYNATTFHSPFEPKANYNIAGILIKQGEAPEYIIKRYKNATKFYPLPYAKLNLINYYILREYYKEAIRETNMTSPSIYKNYQIFVNGAFASLLEKDFDNALQFLKKAGNINPNSPEIFSNIATLYILKQKYDIAKDYITEAININPNNIEVQLNASLYKMLDTTTTIKINEKLSDEIKYNKALLLYNQGQYKKSYLLTRSVFDTTFTTDWGYMDILHMCNLAFLDSLDLAISSYNTNDRLLPPYERNILNHQLAGIFLQYDIPEKAYEYFYKAASLGIKEDSLFGALTDILRGNHEKGLQNLIIFTIKNPSSKYAIIERKLSAILSRIYGDMESYYLYSNYLQSITEKEFFLIGKIAEQTNNIQLAIDFFSTYVDKIDSTNPLPYFITGNIYYNINELNMAEETYLLGLQRNPNSDILNFALFYFYSKHNPNKAEKYFNNLIKLNSEWKKLAKYIKTKNPKHINNIKGKIKYNQYFYKILGETLIKYHHYDIGQEFFYQLSEINNKNPYIWAYLAIFSLKISMLDDYEFCKDNAIKYALNKFDKEKIIKLLEPYDKEYQKAIQETL